VDTKEWVWVIVQNKGQNEEMLGIQDSEQQTSFIPCFRDKEAGLRCEHHLKPFMAANSEFQAIRRIYLDRHAAENGYAVYVLNSDGQIIEKYTPQKSN
jgi:hypothetical protein